MGLPIPEPGLVLNYAYLWHDEYRRGQDEGMKNRPSAVILCEERTANHAVVVTVLPITHSMPSNSSNAIEIPPAIKKRLGLDDERSWIVVSEGNEFVWSGYDLRKIPHSDAYEFGFLPPRFFNQILEAFGHYHNTGKLTTTSRS